jgi:hypothetical protein
VQRQWCKFSAALNNAYYRAQGTGLLLSTQHWNKSLYRIKNCLSVVSCLAMGNWEGRPANFADVPISQVTYFLISLAIANVCPTFLQLKIFVNIYHAL